MDPDATISQLADALREDRLEDAEELREALAEWLERGGFQPDWTTPDASYVMGTLWRVNLLENPGSSYTDLEEVGDPAEVPDVLEYAAQRYYESASELDAAWQDPDAGKPWEMIAGELEASAERIRKKLKRLR